MLVQSPAYILLNTARVSGDILRPSDYIFTGMILTCVVMSAVADQQQQSAYFENGLKIGC